MKDFVKLTKETWQFYLTALCVILLPVVSNNIYILMDLKVEKEKTVHLYKLSEVFIEKADGSDLLNFWVAIMGIVILLFIRHCSVMDKRTMEFQFFLPVKKRMLVLHDYLCIGGIIVISWLVTMCMFVIAQGMHNKEAILINENLCTEAAQAASELWKNGICYGLYLFCAFSLLYFGMVICRNKIAGIAVVPLIWLSVLFLTADLSSDWSEDLYIILLPDEFFRYVQDGGTVSTVLLLGGAVFLLIFAIVLAAEKRELSSGRWFYFRWLDWLPVIFSAVNMASFCYSEWGRENKGRFIVVMMLALAIGVAVVRFCEQSIKNSENKWEVK
ncbi:MAG: ABC-2 transporter permease [Clostridiales bacterium]|nr:ABC-2 transporter permease [Clostridiales bacterium]